jgi:hypothetical protein
MADSSLWGVLARRMNPWKMLSPLTDFPAGWSPRG